MEPPFEKEGQGGFADDGKPNHRKKYIVGDNVTVHIVAERVQYYGPDGKLITESLRDYTCGCVGKQYASMDAFLRRWNSAEQKKAVIDELAAQGVIWEALQEEVEGKLGQLLRQVLNKIQAAVDFNKAQERHAFGDMYEQLLRDLQNAGNAGEFYTPRPVTEFMVRRVDPQLHEKVMDPACGTGGFLTCTIEHKRARYVKTPEDEQILQASLYGVEKKPLPHLLATTNMILHGIEVPSQIRHDNTLARPLISWGPKERVDCIVANPPFGGMEEDGIETNFPAAFRTRETADLFLVLIMHLLKDGGRAAMVLPDGILFGEGIKSRIKEKLLTECDLHTVVRLPNGVFNPYTGIKTNLLFFTKGRPTRDVWFYEHPYPAGVKNYSKTRPMRIEEFAAEEAWWGSEADGFAARVENEQAWKVSVDAIRERGWNLDLKNPHQGDIVSHDPNVLLAEYRQMQAEIAGLQAQLKAALAGALEGKA